MRTLLALLFLCLLAGLVVFAVSRRTQPSALTPGALANDRGADASASPHSGDFSAQPVASAKREELTTAAPAPLPSTASSSATARVVVHVRNQATHEPLAGIRVMVLVVRPAGSSSQPTTDTDTAHGDLHHHPRTGADGVATLTLPPGIAVRLWLRGEHEECSETTVDVAALQEGEVREVDVELLPPNDAHVAGRVVAFDTKAPIAGARVELVRSDMVGGGVGGVEWHSDVLGRAKTGGDGAFALPYTSWVGPYLHVEAEGYSRALVQVSRRHADAADPLVIEMLEESRLTVHLIDASGSGIAGVDVSLESHGWSSAEGAGDQLRATIPDQHWSARTKDDGRATISSLPPSTELRAKAVKNYVTLWSEPEPIELGPGEARELEWRVGAGTRLFGIVLDQGGVPVANQELWVAKSYSEASRYFGSHDRSSARFRGSTDAAGRFVFEDVPAGRWAIGPAASEHPSRTDLETALAPRTVAIELAGEPARELTLRVDRGLYIRGSVIAPDQATLHGAFVQYEGGDGLGVPVSADGSFVCGPLGAGECTLVASCMGQYADSDPVRASAGDSGVRLRLKLGGSLRGQVIDAATGLPCKANIIYSPESQSLGPNGHQSGTSVGADGKFSKPGLAPGRYGISVVTENGRCAVKAGIEISAGVETAGIVLALKPGGWLRFTYHGARESIIVLARSAGVPVSFPLWIQANSRSGVCVPAGTVVLEIRRKYDGPAHMREVELKAGETKEITLTDAD